MYKSSIEKDFGTVRENVPPRLTKVSFRVPNVKPIEEFEATGGGNMSLPSIHSWALAEITSFALRLVFA